MFFAGVGIAVNNISMGALIWHDSSNNGGQGSDLRHHRESSWVQLKSPNWSKTRDRQQGSGSGLVHQGLTLEKIRANKFERSERHSASSLVKKIDRKYNDRLELKVKGKGSLPSSVF